MRLVLVQIVLLLTGAETAKRSPLEIGLVSFEAPHHHNVSAAHGPSSGTGGRSHQHSYLPAHLHHVYIPTHALVVHAVLLHPPVYSPYRSHLGGFGIGVDRGGHGGGHGYHVVFNSL